MPATAQTQFYTLPDGSGCQMAYRTQSPSDHSGSKVPLFLINGLSAVMPDWSPLFETLAATRPVVISDHRGIGESKVGDDWDQELTLESMGMDVIDLAHHLGYREIDLLGFSMGGHITQALLSSPTLAKPHSSGGVLIADKVKVRKAILTATMTKLPRGDVNLNALNKEAATIADKQKRNDFITYNMMKVQYHDAVLTPGSDINNKFESRLKLVRSTNRPAHIIGLQFLAISSADLRKQLHRVPDSLPIMLIHGKQDRMILYSESETTMNHIKHAQRLSDPPSQEFGHFWYDYFNIDYWTTAITNFLDHNKVGGSSAPPSKL